MKSFADLGRIGAPYTCPHCGAVSYHPKDKSERYCGNCHAFELETTEALIAAAGMVTEPGTVGYFTRETAWGALPAGTRIAKRNSEPGDMNADGAPGTVIGSLDAGPSLGIGYFIRWDSRPTHVVFTAAKKVEPDG